MQNNISLPSTDSSSRWRLLAEQVLDGHALSPSEAIAILRSDDAELLDLLAGAYRVRYRFFGNQVHLNLLINAKCGLCGEDCGYCSQSSVSTADIPTYELLNVDDVLAGARLAAERRATTYCIVLSGRTPSPGELDKLTQIISRIKSEHAMRICVSPGLLSAEQAARLKAAGVDRVNHNLNTSRRFYSQICTTHTYQQRLDTLTAVRAAGLEICSGGIVGMGEQDEDVVELALRLGELWVEALPVNFPLPIPGTRLEGVGQMNPRYCLKALCLFRLANPRAELRIAAGRELHLGPLQPLGLYPANSIFVGDYLTTKGQPPSADYEMIRSLGFEIAVDGVSRALSH